MNVEVVIKVDIVVVVVIVVVILVVIVVVIVIDRHCHRSSSSLINQPHLKNCQRSGCS